MGIVFPTDFIIFQGIWEWALFHSFSQIQKPSSDCFRFDPSATWTLSTLHLVAPSPSCLYSRCILFCFVLFKADHADHGRCGGESPVEANHCRSALALSLEAGSFVHPLLSQCRVFTPAQAPFPSSLAPSRGRPRRSRGVVGRSPPQVETPSPLPGVGDRAAPSRVRLRAKKLHPPAAQGNSSPPVMEDAQPSWTGGAAASNFSYLSPSLKRREVPNLNGKAEISHERP